MNQSKFTLNLFAFALAFGVASPELFAEDSSPARSSYIPTSHPSVASDRSSTPPRSSLPNPSIPSGQASWDQDEFDSLTERAYLWGWPLVYLSNVQRSMRAISRAGTSGGTPVAPVNQLSMLTEPVSSSFRSVPCPNPDVVYGFSILDLSNEPVVLQIPQLNPHFWMVQLGDHRTDSFGEIGSLYSTEPGFYLIAGPNWNGDKPADVKQVFRSPTHLAYLIPRILVTSKESLALIQEPIREFSVQPLSKHRGLVRRHDWSKKKWYPSMGETTRQQSKSVRPQSFFQDLAAVLDEVPALPGEEAFYQELRLLASQIEDPQNSERLSARGKELEREIMGPLFDFENVGTQLSSGWTTVHNGASFGNDYRTRAAVAKSNIFVNRAKEAKYFYAQSDAFGSELRSDHDYTITFSKGQLPANQGFWSVTAYDVDHRIGFDHGLPSSLLGTPDGVAVSEDGSTTIHISRTRPADPNARNWIKPPEGSFVLYLRVYAPCEEVINGQWVPPAPTMQNREKPSSQFVSVENVAVNVD